MEYRSNYKDKYGTEVEIRAKAGCLTEEGRRQALGFIAQSSHRFYLEMAERINSKP